MNRDLNQDRLRRLERKVDHLTWLLGAQTILLAIVCLAYVLRISRYLLMLVLVGVPLLIVFRRFLPHVWRGLVQLLGPRERRRIKVGEPPS
jgi:hypothetical protein